jgi:hypothetical protein
MCRIRIISALQYGISIPRVYMSRPFSFRHAASSFSVRATTSSAVLLCPNASTNAPAGSSRYTKMEWSTR